MLHRTARLTPYGRQLLTGAAAEVGPSVGWVSSPIDRYRSEGVIRRVR
jgi:hypothetical protein